ncbi:hypothetical protein DPMN_000783 [Dreissena polymorpha]|uniref:Uncharacterized protein n=1 Tax=Dreissena polymorpha TaxID=45954 RepID=A0A9D4RSC2_DREPO|nr:hypothetical protein DPMN_000783 [Dreissena polymorpha]
MLIPPRENIQNKNTRNENKIFTTASFANIVFTRNVQQCMTEAGHSIKSRQLKSLPKDSS